MPGDFINQGHMTTTAAASTAVTGASSTSSAGLVSYETSHTVQMVFLVAGCGMVSLFGVGSNVINIAVFVRMRFTESINISLLGLAVGDLGCVVTMLWSSICYNPLFADSDLPFNSGEMMYLTGGMTHACFNRITSFLTAFITLERCLCITFPLHVKNFITPFTNKIIIIVIFVSMFAIFCPFYTVNKLEWRLNSSRNKTILTLVQMEQSLLVESVTFPIHSVGMPAMSLLLVVICTTILSVTLTQKAKWRNTSAQMTKRETVSVKEKKVVKMVIILAIVFIVCFFPGTVVFFFMAYEPEFNFGRKYNNIGVLIWAVVLFLETINSSANIFVYYSMSSKFKATLTGLLNMYTDTNQRLET
ncbi:hypothetical protein BsWGS_06249 [Bradybaena similaris]